MRTAIIIPALNEEAAIGKVVANVIEQVDRVIVVDNGSEDRTAEVAANAGAEVIFVQRKGYGRACLAGAAMASDVDVLVFMDGDSADDPNDLAALLEPIRQGIADFVVGSRALGQSESGALSLPQRWGNKLAAILMKLFWGSQFTDLGPFRAIRRPTYLSLNMRAPTYGWTVEMQTRALKGEIRCAEVPVAYRRRIGTSKISGTIKGVCLAGGFILGTIFWEAFTRSPIQVSSKNKRGKLSTQQTNSVY